MRILATVVCVLLCCIVSLAEKPRVFITDSQSWEISGGGGGSNGTWGSSMKGGARPQTAEIIKTFGERCKDVVINNKKEKADYIVLLDHEGGKGWIRKDNKVAVFNSEGDSIVSHSTRSLGGSVEDACKAIQNDWAGKGGTRAEAKVNQQVEAGQKQIQQLLILNKLPTDKEFSDSVENSMAAWINSDQTRIARWKAGGDSAIDVLNEAFEHVIKTLNAAQQSATAVTAAPQPPQKQEESLGDAARRNREQKQQQTDSGNR